MHCLRMLTCSFSIYRQCLVLLPKCFELHLDFAQRLIKDEDMNEAKSYLEKVIIKY